MHILLGQFYSSQPTPDYDKIAASLRERGDTVWVGTPNATGDIEWQDGRGIAVTLPAGSGLALPRPLARLGKLAQFVRVRRFIRQSRPDIVQLNASDLFRFLPVGMPRRTRFILDVRQTNDQHGRGSIGRVRAALQNRSRALYSRFLFARTTFLHPAGAQHVLGDDWARWATVVPMGVDPRFLVAGRDRAAGSSTLAHERDNHPVSFIYIGRLTRRRRLERILEAAAQVRQQTDCFRVVFMGFDASEGFYQEAIRRLGLESIAAIRPPIPYEAVPDAVLANDVALAYVPEVPADWQYHPTLKILEYRALGMPVIATDVLPNRELVESGGNGLLIQNTVESIAAAMSRYVCDPRFLAHSRARAQEMRTGLVWDEVATQYSALYDKLLASRAR